MHLDILVPRVASQADSVHPSVGHLGHRRRARVPELQVIRDAGGARSGLEWLAANGHRLPWTRTHRTRSGGKHRTQR